MVGPPRRVDGSDRLVVSTNRHAGRERLRPCFHRHQRATGGGRSAKGTRCGRNPCRRISGGATAHPRQCDRGAPPASTRSSRWGAAAACRLALELRLARDEIRCPREDLALLDAPIENANAALDELRELAAGVHPSTLTRLGLPAAINALARRSPLPVDVSATVPDRLSEGLEANSYFLIAEALTNAVKHPVPPASRCRCTATGAHSSWKSGMTESAAPRWRPLGLV